MTERAVFKPITTAGTFSFTVSSTVRTLPVPSNAQKLLLQVETNDVRVTFDGSAPAAGVGLLYTPGVDYTIEGWDSLTGFKCIRDSADAKIVGQFFTKE